MPVGHPITLAPYVVLTVLLAAAIVVCVPSAWNAVRLLVTLVHELGHAGVGILSGRRFTGFVVSRDGSGHAVTVGRSRGPGRIATTWAGYPMPALVGGLLVWASLQGWAAPLLGAILLALLTALVRVRSVLTLTVLAVTGGLTGWLWWSGTGRLQTQTVMAVGVLLLVGAWRHLATVWRGGRRIDDPEALASLTGIPAGVWVASWALVCAAVSWPVMTALASAVTLSP